MNSYTSNKLRGQTPVDLGEFFEWALLLGVQVLPENSSDADLVPAVY